MIHGTPSGYTHHGCRCSDCTRAQRESARRSERRARANRAVLMPGSAHGAITGYRYWGCRCEPCTEVSRLYQRALRARAATTT